MQRSLAPAGDAYVRVLASARPPSTPCDLDAVRSWLDAQQKRADERGDTDEMWLQTFEDLVRRVCDNAISFNGPKTAVGVCAKALKLGFQERLKQFRHSSVPPGRGLRAPEREGAPNFDEKAELYRDVCGLDLLDQSRVGRLIAESCPAAVAPLDERELRASKRVRVDLDAVDAPTFARAKALADERATKAFENQMQDEYG